MGKSIYINGISAISAQTEEAIFSDNALEYSSNIFHAVPVDYREVIPPMALRRMSAAIKMGLFSANNALADANETMPDAIITATGEGCKQDTEKFLEGLLDQNEALLSPTSFIQSTHNTVGGQIALSLNCTGYNVTYSQEDISLESAFLDAILLLEEDPEIKNVLVGSVDEISTKITSFSYLNNFLKNKEIKNLDLFDQASEGTITSEGAFFFSVSAEKSSISQVELLSVSTFQEKDISIIPSKIQLFLKKNNSSLEVLDLVILGKNGDQIQDSIYEYLEKGLFQNTTTLAYKHLAGDFNTVTGFAMWLTCKIFKNNSVPEILKLNSVASKDPELGLLYNLSQDNCTHSVILLRKI